MAATVLARAMLMLVFAMFVLTMIAVFGSRTFSCARPTRWYLSRHARGLPLMLMIFFVHMFVLR